MAGAFGQRRFVALTVVLVIGLALVVARLRRGPGRLALAAAVALLAWWNIGLIVQFGTGLMDRQRLEPGRNAYNTFVTVPRQLPAIAYRYLVDRDRFYRPAPAADHRP